ncbi:DNA-binding protein [Metarhizium album ARSEF 1941]|uniref:DNA-binding protein n=1 Tax=Metarhizium album (strain ARSEF 1941) TaxID=1081103 RepID=A0A0B2WF31_METAS|nr:DNA-binding protein [Metarhizium album ARSEF 1941]KHN94506.1 DNA-binding protein [Metarhizium album ARSEF 1941]
MKDKREVTDEFNDIVNMTAAELEEWLKSDDSKAAGWPKQGNGEESVGHDSGRKIVQILKDNPQKSPGKYTEDHVQHMRKVVSYCKRHLAQESKANDQKSVEEVKKTKSYASLKNWGHDPLKAREGDNRDHEGEEEKRDEEAEITDENEDGKEDGGTKRASKDSQNGENKRQKTENSAPNKEANDGGAAESTDSQDKKDGAETKGDAQKSSHGQDDSRENKKNGNSDKNGSAGDGAGGKEPKKGDTVSWNWGQGQPEGTVKDVKHEKASVTTKKGNTVSRDGTAEDPAVVIDAGQSKAVKLNHELN